MIRYYCTLFDINYIIKGLTTLRSLIKFSDNLLIFVLCMDDETKSLLEKINIRQIKCISLHDVEEKRLLKAKSKRTKAEYCWTMASSFTWYVLQKNKEIELLTYIDADLLFYSDPEPIFSEISDSSIGIIEHRFASPFEYLQINGKFCVEWNTFRRDKEGLQCLNEWREQCLDWCFNRVEEGKMGDQKYLDEWPNTYINCHIIKNKGAGIAPWNYSNYEIKNSPPNILIDDQKLIFYHFHQFQLLDNNTFYRLSNMYQSNKKEPIQIYEDYEREILKSLSIIRDFNPNFKAGIQKKRNFDIDKLKGLVPKNIKSFIRSFW